MSLGGRVIAIAAVAIASMPSGGCKASRDAPDARSTIAGEADDDGVAHSARVTCAPGDVGEAGPAAEQPAMEVGRGACSDAAVAALFDACFVPGGDCAAWKTANGACGRCVFTPEGAAVQGPFTTRENARPKANQRGCLDSLAGGCGSAYETAMGCTHAACERNRACTSATSEELAACRQAAMHGPCKSAMQQFSTKCGPGGLADKRVCFPPDGGDATLRTYFAMLALRACGSGGVR